MVRVLCGVIGCGCVVGKEWVGVFCDGRGAVFLKRRLDGGDCLRVGLMLCFQVILDQMKFNSNATVGERADCMANDGGKEHRRYLGRHGVNGDTRWYEAG